MKFSENWLRTWVNPALTSEELAHLLTMAGLEVEALEAVAPAFDEVFVAVVQEVVKHPKADRLNICQVDVGLELPLTIVCGAANVAVGVKVPCARIGAVLPGNFSIKLAKVRNVESYGMLCSEKELGLAAESQGLWLLPPDAPVGQSLRAYLDLDDKLYTLKLTPNRSDCTSILGVAREVAALTGSALEPLLIPEQSFTLSAQLPVTVQDAAACPLYCGRLVHGVNAAAITPVWMKRRLERSGLRSISAVVDITNYVMLEMGQPLHAFDAAQLSGGVTVRRAALAESLTLLNGQSIALDGELLVIANQVRVLALAGIMGGQDSSVGAETRDIFLESAFFHPDAIAGRARRFGLATDSSFRFERGVDFAATRQALERATHLLLQICGGSIGPISEVCGILPERKAILLRPSRVGRVLGISLDNEQIASLLRRLQLHYSEQEGNFCVIPSSFRFDLSIEADLIEELARLHGYDHIPASPPEAVLAMLPCSELQRPMAQFAQLLVARDYQEIVSYAFVDREDERLLCGNADPVALQNPIASNLAVMRSSLIAGLVGALRFNLNRKQGRVRLFEFGACFARQQGNYSQSQRLSGLAYGDALPEQWGVAARPVDFYDVKADVVALFAPRELRFVASVHPALHPGRSAQICCGTQQVGWIGELHPRLQQQYDMAQAAVWFEIDTEVLQDATLPPICEINKMLPVRRDVAVLVAESVNVETLLDAMFQAAVPYVQEIALFDVYRGKGLAQGKKSLAFRVLLKDTKKSLTDAEIETSISLLVDRMEQHGALLRV